MNNKEALKNIFRDFAENLPLSVTNRNVTIPINTGKIITVTGVRRGGKTSVMMDTINQLLKLNRFIDINRL
jgi:uncharacterized protein